jgi:uncharacterized protein (TIGR02599 family)
MLVSTAVVVLLVVMLSGIMQQTSTVWSRTTGKIEQFREARTAFDTMTRRLSQATLNTYWDYVYQGSGASRIPVRYQRRSELRFISGRVRELLGTDPADQMRLTHAVFFQAPLGMVENAKYRGFENLLCTWGYYVEVGGDTEYRPGFLTEDIAPPRFRSRLMELWVPSEHNLIYRYTSGMRSSGAEATTYIGKDWFTQPLTWNPPPVHVLAENVLALVITPRLAPEDESEIANSEGDDHSPLAPNYLYDSSPVIGAGSDSRYGDARLNPVAQLPPVLRVTMVAIDEGTALRRGPTESDKDPFGLESRLMRSREYSRDVLRSESGDTDSLEDQLIEARANYRVFTTNVVVRGAKWSREQTN